MDVFRIFESRDGVLTELAFVLSLESSKEYLQSCNKHNTAENVFYFAEKIKLQK